VDQYDALRTERPYKRALNHRAACRVMLEGDGRTLPQHFDPALLAAFREIHSEFDQIHARYTDAARPFAPAPAETPADKPDLRSDWTRERA